MQAQAIKIHLPHVELEGDFILPDDAQGIVLFAHGSGSGRKSPRNQMVAQHLNSSGFGTLLFDLLTFEEEELDVETGDFRFNIGFLAGRLFETTLWLKDQPYIEELPFGYFGASTGAAAALHAAEMNPQGQEIIKAIVSRGGRPDLATVILPLITAPTLLIVGENDPHVLTLNRQAFNILHCEKTLEIIPGATHLFEEPGALEEVARLAAQWFKNYLTE
jgi:dienelactone hydrolase